METVNIYEAKTHLSELVQRASEGEEIIIARNGKPAARLVPLEPKPKREPGGWEGQIWMAPDFDSCDEEIADLFFNSEIEPK